MKRIYLLPLVACLALAACGDDPSTDTSDTPDQESDRTTNYWDPYVDWTFTVVETPNGPVECVGAWHNKGGGPSCNWDKYNSEQENSP